MFESHALSLMVFQKFVDLNFEFMNLHHRIAILPISYTQCTDFALVMLFESLNLNNVSSCGLNKGEE